MINLADLWDAALQGPSPVVRSSSNRGKKRSSRMRDVSPMRSLYYPPSSKKKKKKKSRRGSR